LSTLGYIDVDNAESRAEPACGRIWWTDAEAFVPNCCLTMGLAANQKLALRHVRVWIPSPGLAQVHEGGRPTAISAAP